MARYAPSPPGGRAPGGRGGSGGTPKFTFTPVSGGKKKAAKPSRPGAKPKPRSNTAPGFVEGATAQENRKTPSAKVLKTAGGMMKAKAKAVVKTARMRPGMIPGSVGNLTLY